jgi:integrase
MAGCTGLRISEVMGLRWSLINFESLVMQVREGYARSQVTKLKSECSQDELPLDPDVATILLEWKRLCPETQGNWVFPSPRTDKPLRFWLAPKESAQDRGVTGEDSGMDRLALASSQLPRLARRDWCAPLGVQQKLMRHANISTTMNVYGGAFMEAKRKATHQSYGACCFKTTSNSKRPSRGRSLFLRFEAYWTISDHNRKSKFLVTQ